MVRSLRKLLNVLHGNKQRQLCGFVNLVQNNFEQFYNRNIKLLPKIMNVVVKIARQLQYLTQPG